MSKKKIYIDENELSLEPITINEAYNNGISDGVDTHWLYVQFAIERLIKKNKIKDKNLIEKIEKELDKISINEFYEWMDDYD